MLPVLSEEASEVLVLLSLSEASMSVSLDDEPSLGRSLVSFVESALSVNVEFETSDEEALVALVVLERSVEFVGSEVESDWAKRAVMVRNKRRR